MRLVYTLVYLNQFNLNIYYYLGYLNIIPDILLYLNIIKKANILNNNKLKYIIFATEIIINPEFK